MMAGKKWVGMFGTGMKSKVVLALTLLLIVPAFTLAAALPQGVKQQELGVQHLPSTVTVWPPNTRGDSSAGLSAVLPSHGPYRDQTFSSTTVSSGSSNYWVGEQVAIQNTGVQATIQVVSEQVTGCLSYWIGDDSAANIWGQVGYYLCDSSTPIAFYQIWNLNTYSVLVTGTTSVSTGNHQFSMYLQS